MIRQDFAIPVSGKGSAESEKGHVWEVRHAGLLGVKYEVAVRNDLFEVREEGVPIESGREILRGVVEAAVLG
jgi:TATA-binding protein-associated factor